MRSGHSDVSWFLRAARVVPVIAGAALLGGMIGGFAIYAIDSALTWEPTPRPDAHAENQATAVNPQTTKPVRIVGGAIPDPSAGMSAPPPAPQQRSAAQSPAQISPALLTPKPLGPASQLQPQTATAAPPPSSGVPQPPNQTANQPQIQQPQVQAPVQTQNAAQSASRVPQQQTRWPDALSRAHQNAANAQRQTAPANAPAASAPTSEGAATKNSEADDQDRANSSRHGRYSRRHTMVGSRNGGDDDASAAAASSPRQEARGYNRLYDSYGNRRDRSYRNTREQSYGDRDDQNASQNASYGNRRDRFYRKPREQFYGDTDNQNDAASRSDLSRSDRRRYGGDAGYRGRSRVIDREQPEETDRTSAAARPRPEPFWGGGFFRRGDREDD